MAVKKVVKKAGKNLRFKAMTDVRCDGCGEVKPKADSICSLRHGESEVENPSDVLTYHITLCHQCKVWLMGRMRGKLT